jgi:hypothetical protein
MATASESSNAPSRVAPPGFTIRGKRFVAPFVIVLLLLLAWTLSIAIQFQTIMTRLDRARSDWPAASQDLAKRFAVFDADLKSSGVSINDADLAAWNEAYAAYQETSQYDRQSIHAAILERIRSKTGDRSVPLESTPSIKQLLAREQDRLQAQQSMVGRWAITALRLKLPGTFTSSE